MENQATDPARASIDHRLIEAVEAEIARALEQACQLEAGADALFVEPDLRSSASLARISENLAGWESRVAELTRRTAEVEVDLNHQEAIVRNWLASMATTSTRLAKASGQ